VQPARTESENAIIERLRARSGQPPVCVTCRAVSRAPRRSPRAGSHDQLDVLCLATQGSNSGDEQRIAYLLEPLRPRFVPVDRGRKARLPGTLLSAVLRRRPDVIVMEGTGAAGGLAVMSVHLLCGVPYIVSSGDAVGPFLRAFHPATWPIAALYECALVRLCAGFIGWSPYLVGRALSRGAPRAMTAAHFSLSAPRPGAREATRRRLGIPEEAIVIGIVGRIIRDPRHAYSYGVDLIRALHRTDRLDVYVLIVGDGEGLDALADLAGHELGRRVLLTGGCPPESVADHLAAMDIGVLSQSTDLVGAMRYTTKLPEYLAAGLPVIVTQTPLAYDLDSGWLWRLPGDSPWDESHVEALADLMRHVSREDIADRRARLPDRLDVFDPSRQQQRVCAFVREATSRWRARRT
jgi:glycosyltransferase involved in cell wall biosynthesis